MKHKFAFTYDNGPFNGLPEYVDDLRANHTRYIIILVSVVRNVTQSVGQTKEPHIVPKQREE